MATASPHLAAACRAAYTNRTSPAEPSALADTAHPTPHASDPSLWPDRYGDALFRYAMSRLGEATAAEDAVQDTFLAGLQAWDGFKGQSAELTWLTGILKHKIIDHLRKHARETTVDAPQDRLDEFFDKRGHWKLGPQRWVQPNEALENEQFLAVLERCIGALPHKLAQVFMLVEFDGADNKTLCAALGISDGNLWVRLHRARLRLRQCLENRWFSKP